MAVTAVHRAIASGAGSSAQNSHIPSGSGVSITRRSARARTARAWAAVGSAATTARARQRFKLPRVWSGARPSTRVSASVAASSSSTDRDSAIAQTLDKVSCPAANAAAVAGSRVSAVASQTRFCPALRDSESCAATSSAANSLIIPSGNALSAGSPCGPGTSRRPASSRTAESWRAWTHAVWRSQAPRWDTRSYMSRPAGSRLASNSPSSVPGGSCSRVIRTQEAWFSRTARRNLATSTSNMCSSLPEHPDRLNPDSLYPQTYFQHPHCTAEVLTPYARAHPRPSAARSSGTQRPLLPLRRQLRETP